MVGRPLPEESRLLGLRGPRPGQVLQVHARPQGRGHPVPVRHDRLLPHRRPVRHGDQERVAVADLPPHRPEQYLMVVGEHGTMMMMIISTVILGPFGQYFGPLLIGSKRVAFPRLEALGFWLTPPAYVILLSAVLMGGFSTGWTGYEPPATQATQGEDAYFFAFGLMGISMILAGFNMIVTVITYRAPGMRWSRLPMFVWSMFTVSFLQVLSVPVLVGGVLYGADRPDFPDRVLRQPARREQLPVRGPVCSSAIPRCTSWPCPASGSSPRWSPCSAGNRCSATRWRRPACSGSGSCPSSSGSTTCSTAASTRTCARCSCSRPQLISIPTGFIYLVGMGTFWKARIRFSHPDAVRAGVLL